MSTIGGVSPSTGSIPLAEGPTTDVVEWSTTNSLASTPLYLGLMFGESLGALGLRPAAPGESSATFAGLLIALDKLMTNASQGKAQNAAAKLAMTIQSLRNIARSVQSLEDEIDVAEAAKQGFEAELNTAEEDEAAAADRFEKAKGDYLSAYKAYTILGSLKGAFNASDEARMREELDNLEATPGYEDEARDLRAKLIDREGLRLGLNELTTSIRADLNESWGRRNAALDDLRDARKRISNLNDKIDGQQQIIDADAAAIEDLKDEAAALRAELPPPAEIRALIGLGATEAPIKHLVFDAFEEMDEQGERVRRAEESLQNRVADSRRLNEKPDLHPAESAGTEPPFNGVDKDRSTVDEDPQLPSGGDGGVIQQDPLLPPVRLDRLSDALADMLMQLADVANALQELVSAPQARQGPHVEEGERLKLLG